MWRLPFGVRDIFTIRDYLPQTQSYNQYMIASRHSLPRHPSFPIARRAPAIALIVAGHALLLFAMIFGERIVRFEPLQAVMLLQHIPAKIVHPPPPPPPPPPPRMWRKQGPAAREAAAPPLRDIEVPPRTDIVASITDSGHAVTPAGGRPDGSGTEGAGNVGNGAGGAGGGRLPVEVRAVLDPANCIRPELPDNADARRHTGHVIVAVMIDVDGRVTAARLARSSGRTVLDQVALRAALQCRFVAATIDQVPVRSWEPFRFSWIDR